MNLIDPWGLTLTPASAYTSGWWWGDSDTNTSGGGSGKKNGGCAGEGTNPNDPGRRRGGRYVRGPKNYTREETQQIINEATSNLMDDNIIKDLGDSLMQHGGAGKYDFAANEEGSTFNVNGETMDAGEFGNYVAGYANTAAFGSLGTTATCIVGTAYAWADRKAESRKRIFQGASHGAAVAGE